MGTHAERKVLALVLAGVMLFCGMGCSRAEDAGRDAAAAAGYGTGEVQLKAKRNSEHRLRQIQQQQQQQLDKAME